MSCLSASTKRGRRPIRACSKAWIPPGTMGGDHLLGVKPEGLGGEGDLGQVQGHLFQDAPREEALLHVAHHPFPQDHLAHEDPVAHGLPREHLQVGCRPRLGVVVL